MTLYLIKFKIHIKFLFDSNILKLRICIIKDLDAYKDTHILMIRELW